MDSVGAEMLKAITRAQFQYAEGLRSKRRIHGKLQSMSGEPLGVHATLSTLFYMLTTAIQTSVSSIHFNIFIHNIYATV